MVRILKGIFGSKNSELESAINTCRTKAKKKFRSFLKMKPEDFYKSLCEEETILILFRENLYSGSWEPMERDLIARLEGTPYLFKLINGIEEDLERIEKLKTYEEHNEVNLNRYIR